MSGQWALWDTEEVAGGLFWSLPGADSATQQDTVAQPEVCPLLESDHKRLLAATLSEDLTVDIGGDNPSLQPRIAFASIPALFLDEFLTHAGVSSPHAKSLA